MVPTTIQEMYPPVAVKSLVSEAGQRRFDDLFLESGELDADPFEIDARITRPHSKCVSTSLFKKNVDNRFADEFPFDEITWRRKYWDGLNNVVQEMSRLPDWKLRVYVERGLYDETCLAFSSHPQVELYRMKSCSIGGSPGMMWRFLALADTSLDVTLVTDIDESLSQKSEFITSFEDHDSSIGRLGGFLSDRDYLVSPHESDAKNYA
ncbi:MAG: hypothetical protein IID33_14970, partial [Planctomycetes bacterium]|nr:hypothetical protein [Planctomycetota bacterium]